MAAAARAAPFETGGVLMGYHGEQATIVITHVIGPGPNARHERRIFVPDHEYQDAEISRIYAASGRVSTYIGDWHSHPDGTENLSARDRHTLRTIARTATARAPQPIMMIISGATEWHITIHTPRTWWRTQRLKLHIA